MKEATRTKRRRLAYDGIKFVEEKGRVDTRQLGGGTYT
jgi:hypothetical protein